MVNKPITHVEENIVGFVGSSLRIDNKPTSANRPRIKFDIFKGNDDLSNLKLATIRHCVGYDGVAEKLHDLRAGELLRVTGYIITEVKRDYMGKPIFITGGIPVREDTLMIQDAVRINYRPKQSNLFDNFPPGGGCPAVDVDYREPVSV